MIQLKEEFKNLIPPLTQEEFRQLEQNIIAEGIRENILTWQGIIIDGHNRYKIATKWGLEYETTSKHFKDEEAVKEWMILNQFGRRNLSNYQRSVLALQLEEVFTKKAKENLGRNQYSTLQNSAESKPIDTRKELSKVASVSHDTITRVKKIEEKADEETKAKLRTGEISINQAYTDIKKELYKEKIQNRIEKKTEEPISLEEQDLLNRIEKGETVVINMNNHYHVLKYAKEKGIYKQIDRFSEFGNPFFINSDGDRDEVCDGYIEYLKHKRSLHPKIKDLKGKVLGCHCAPLRCHGDHLKALLDEA